MLALVLTYIACTVMRTNLATWLGAHDSLVFTVAHSGSSEVKSHLQRLLALLLKNNDASQVFLIWKSTQVTQLSCIRIPYTKCYLGFLSEPRVNQPSFKNCLQNAALVGCLERARSTHLCRESRHKSFPAIADLLLTHSSALLLTYFQLLPCMLLILV